MGSDAEPAAESVETSVFFSGSNEWDLMWRSNLPTGHKEMGMTGAGRQMLSPELIPGLEGKKVTKVVAGPTAAHVIALTAAGKVYVWGRNEAGQLGIPDLRRRNCPTELDALDGCTVIGAAAGKNHSLFLADDGAVFSAGSNACGQLGVGSLAKQQFSVPQRVDTSPLGNAKAVRVSCGAEFSILVADDGAVYSFGHPEYGQTGQGTTGMYIKNRREEYSYASSPELIKTLSGTKIVDIACGAHSTVALDDQGKIYTWGWGAYGRLGHKGPKDELVPRMVDKMSKVSRVFAGSKFHYAITEHNQCYFWGQVKSSGEATMYPKAVQDLSGVRIRDMCCGPTTTMVCFNNSLAAWGPSPAYGELCYGEKEKNKSGGGPLKTSTKPKMCDCMEGVMTLSVALGLQFSVMVVESGSDVVKDFPVLDDEDVPIDKAFTAGDLNGTATGGAEKGGKKRGRSASSGGKAKGKKRK